ncbi:MAG: 4Fe-4S binding protein [Bacteroidales bacterium]
MKKFLKPFRVVVSLIFLLFTTFIFLDFSEILSTSQIRAITWLQFIPSVLKFINVLGIAAIGFAVVLVLTMLFGRVYCSTICPLGIMQDVVNYVSGKFNKRRRIFRYSKAKNYWRYGFLALTILFLLAGSITALNFLDPYSIYGKIASGAFRPLYVGINNELSGILQSMNIYSISPVDLKSTNYIALIFPVFMLGLVGYLSYTRGRLYCNSVCPVGTFLGLVSRFSLYKIDIDEKGCDMCGRCSAKCKAQCIDIKNKKVDFSRCVGCFNCLPSCPNGSIGYTLDYLKSTSNVENTASAGKRDFLKSAGTFLLAMVGVNNLIKAGDSSSVEVTKKTVIPEDKQYPVTPPGSLGIEHFTNYCTACHLCVSACPAHVIKPSTLQYGLQGFMQPHMDYHSSFCTYDCTICSEVCPTGAIMPLNLKEKKTTQLGKVIFIKESCVVFTENTACGSCSEHCPTQAVKMVPYKDDLTIPETDPDICVGCGACEYACPTRPFRAIYVDGNPTHQVAKMPTSEKVEEGGLEEFPF